VRHGSLHIWRSALGGVARCGQSKDSFQPGFLPTSLLRSVILLSFLLSWSSSYTVCYIAENINDTVQYKYITFRGGRPYAMRFLDTCDMLICTRGATLIYFTIIYQGGPSIVQLASSLIITFRNFM
jgi:hypothetical protein